MRRVAACPGRGSAGEQPWPDAMRAGHRLQAGLDHATQWSGRGVHSGVHQQASVAARGPGRSLAERRPHRCPSEFPTTCSVAGGQIQLQVCDLCRGSTQVGAQCLPTVPWQTARQCGGQVGVQSGRGVQPAQCSLAGGIGVVIDLRRFSARRPVLSSNSSQASTPSPLRADMVSKGVSGNRSASEACRVGQLGRREQVGFVQHDQIGLFELLFIDVEDVVGKAGRCDLAAAARRRRSSTRTCCPSTSTENGARSNCRP